MTNEQLEIIKLIVWREQKVMLSNKVFEALREVEFISVKPAASLSSLPDLNDLRRKISSCVGTYENSLVKGIVDEIMTVVAPLQAENQRLREQLQAAQPIEWLEEASAQTEASDVQTKSLTALREYLKNTPKEQFQKEWKEIEAMGFEGPTVEEFLEWQGCYAQAAQPVMEDCCANSCDGFKCESGSVHKVLAQPPAAGEAVVLPTDEQLEDWVMDGYERTDKNKDRVRIAVYVRDRIAEQFKAATQTKGGSDESS